MQRPMKFRELETVVLVRGVRDEDFVSVRSVALAAKAMVPRDSDGDESQK